MSVNRIPKLFLLLSAALVVVALACGGGAPAAAPASAPASPIDRASVHGAPPGVELPKLIGPRQYDGPPPMLIDPNKKYTAYIEMTKGKEIIVDLIADKAPKTVNNFVFLARDGFYDGLGFYEVNVAADARAGDPTGTGTGGPGYFIDDEFHFDLFHKFLAVTMHNDGTPNTNGSRFMIITVGVTKQAGAETRESSATEYLNGLDLDGSLKDCADPEVSCHSMFGRVTGSTAGPSASQVSLIRGPEPKDSR